MDRLYAAPPPTSDVSDSDGGGRTVDSVSNDTRRTAKVLALCVYNVNEHAVSHITFNVDVYLYYVILQVL